MIETDRMMLRPWVESDVQHLFQATNTPDVMLFLGGLQEPEAFEAAFHRHTKLQTENGFCFWIMERRTDSLLLGSCGLKVGTLGPITGEIEIGWRLRRDAWGQGYAREAAMATLDWTWRNLGCRRVVATTVRDNARSWGLMERLGMCRDITLDFDHPDYPLGHLCRPHITYIKARPVE
jgi:RimJ/RimL family protein N-acetyltransferase